MPNKPKPRKRFQLWRMFTKPNGLHISNFTIKQFFPKLEPMYTYIYDRDR